jgi:hypothetical protein
MSLKPGTNYTVTKHTAIGKVTSVTKDPFSPTQIGRTHISAQTFTVPTADVNNSDHCIQVDHNLSDGDALVYHSMGGDSITLDGSVMDPDTVEVSIQENTIHDVAKVHNLETGDKVNYSKGAGDAIGGISNDTRYYAIKVDANSIKLATTYSNAIAGTEIPLTGTGNDAQKIQNCLQDNKTYYISRKTGSETSEFYLHANKNAALLSGGGGVDKLVIDNALKGNNSQVFSTSFGRLSPKVD